LEAVLRQFHGAVEEGAFAVMDRKPPTGNEWAVWAGDIASPIGFATYVEAGAGNTWLDLVYVEPAHRRKGVGGALVAAVAQSAQCIGCSALVLGIAVGNLSMRKVVNSVGFAQVGTVHRLSLPHTIEARHGNDTA
jgi:predicted GNAT family acetyltransferase